jgi:hypothetical protein
LINEQVSICNVYDFAVNPGIAVFITKYQASANDYVALLYRTGGIPGEMPQVGCGLPTVFSLTSIIVQIKHYF